ncbi:unnamed protein product [Dovyalis caffra]|uniref:Uncharacterized protein n=1 Tax=Dovyalis caffra TaxID=77055 RepID=A0AAV1RH00_9ROSI|nr:unnamed protein product [Dovyalis caffra]
MEELSSSRLEEAGDVIEASSEVVEGSYGVRVRGGRRLGCSNEEKRRLSCLGDGLIKDDVGMPKKCEQEIETCGPSEVKCGPIFHDSAIE